MRIKTVMVAGAMMLVATNANAMLKVTNLSNVPQTVVFTSAGADTIKVIQPSETERFSGTDGLLSLAKPAGQKGMAPAGGGDPNLSMSGMGAGIIGAVRTSNIPASQMDEFVIWPNGQLMLQKRQKSGTDAR